MLPTDWLDDAVVATDWSELRVCVEFGVLCELIDVRLDTSRLKDAVLFSNAAAAV